MSAACVFSHPPAARAPMTETITIHCPYCGESYESVADLSAGSQQYIEDCAICCKPIEIGLQVGDDGELEGITTRSDSE